MNRDIVELNKDKDRVKRNLLFLLTMYTLNLSAQFFDPFDFIFEPDDQILRPAEVIEHHVATCTICDVDSLDKVITYDGNRRVLHDDSLIIFIYTMPMEI